MTSNENPRAEFSWLIQQCTKENFIHCFHELDGKKAVGIDGKSKDEYEENLEQNIESLVNRMKELKYYPSAVREVKIPKADGQSRSLGISNIEDKIVQSMFAKILTSIYEPVFVKESYGFRPNKGCHGAIKDVYDYLAKTWFGVVIDVDLSNFFGTIDHRKLIKILELKIKDKVFLRYIIRMLKAGVLSGGELSKSDNGTPQGSIVSPILANIFAHYAIDIWLGKTVPKYVSRDIHFVRYADDFVICTSKRDAPKVLKALKGRLKRFSLEVNLDKTKVVKFSRGEYNQGAKQESFDFLGFTFYIAKSRKGKATVKIKTACKTLRAKLKAMSKWYRLNRHKYRLADLWRIFSSKLRGHIQYYGVSHNAKGVEAYIHAARRVFFKWINRRSQRRSMSWDKFQKYEQLNPLPKARIVHLLF